MAVAAESERVLVVKRLTFSDASYDVSKSGRVVLPRAQVEDCLVELLELGGAPYVLNELKQGDPLRLAVDLDIYDEMGNKWVVTMKTWQNVVAGQHRPTFVLENTVSPFKVLGFSQGNILSIIEADGRLRFKKEVDEHGAKGNSGARSKVHNQRPAVSLATGPRTKKSKVIDDVAVPPSPPSRVSTADMAAATVLLSLSSDSHGVSTIGDESITSLRYDSGSLPPSIEYSCGGGYPVAGVGVHATIGNSYDATPHNALLSAKPSAGAAFQAYRPVVQSGAPVWNHGLSAQQHRLHQVHQADETTGRITVWSGSEIERRHVLEPRITVSMPQPEVLCPHVMPVVPSVEALLTSLQMAAGWPLL